MSGETQRERCVSCLHWMMHLLLWNGKFYVMSQKENELFLMFTVWWAVTLSRLFLSLYQCCNGSDFSRWQTQTNVPLLKCLTVCIHNSERWQPWRRGWEVQLPVQTTAASPESLCQKHPLCYFLNVCLHVCLCVCMCVRVCASNIPSGKI